MTSTNEPPPSRDQSSPQAAADPYAPQRHRMVEDQLRQRDIREPRVLEAMKRVPRHRFVLPSQLNVAYDDHPLPIGFQQTISQPYIVGYMSEALLLSKEEKALEIGTGSGYQAAILGELAKAVYTIEIIPELGERAKGTLAQLGYSNVHVRVGDGYQGWPEEAPFDAIVVTAAPDHIPPALVEQLAVNGRMVIPLGAYFQEIVIVTKTKDGVVQQKTIPVRFVPMTGKAEKKD